MNTLTVRWTSLASRRLDEIGAYISRDDEAAAARVVGRILAATERLAYRPMMGRPGRIRGTCELVLPDIPYILPYRIAGTELHILSVLHMAQRWPASL